MFLVATAVGFSGITAKEKEREREKNEIINLFINNIHSYEEAMTCHLPEHTRHWSENDSQN